MPSPLFRAYLSMIEPLSAEEDLRLLMIKSEPQANFEIDYKKSKSKLNYLRDELIRRTTIGKPYWEITECDHEGLQRLKAQMAKNKLLRKNA